MTSFNEQAAFLIEDAVALIKQVLIKHSAAVLEEMRDQIVARNTRIAALESEVAALRAEVEGMREDAERYRWWLKHRETTLVIAIFGNGCINKEISDVHAYIDAARKESSK